MQPSSSIDLHLALADLLRVSFTPSRTDEACTLLDRVCTRLSPDSAPAWAHYGALLHVRGQHARAKDAYERALQLRPQDETTRVNLQKVMRVISRANKKLWFEEWSWCFIVGTLWSSLQTINNTVHSQLATQFHTHVISLNMNSTITIILSTSVQ